MTEPLTFRLRNMFACACKEPAEAADRIEKLEAEVKRLEQQLKMAHSRLPKWQPIETAPKDDTEVLVFCEDGGVLIGCFAGGMWWIEQTYYEKRKPTHWMPLPPAPPKKGDE